MEREIAQWNSHIYDLKYAVHTQQTRAPSQAVEDHSPWRFLLSLGLETNKL